ncbi:MAG: efflux pump, inner rane subunit [Acidobacteriales bacterium]|nr:efflux pump, inner rane subunit [Terriglobales bacterium]
MASTSRVQMFARLLMRSAVMRRGRTLTALLAMVIAAAVATSLSNLYVDIDSKLTTEFRKFGANAVVIATGNNSLAPESIARIQKSLGPQDIAVPFGYLVAKTASGKPVVVAGTEFAGAKRLNGWWSVTSWPNTPQSALVGERAFTVLNAESDPGLLTFNGRQIRISNAGTTVHTGGAEDSRIYMALPEFVAWSGVQPSTVELAISGSPESVNDTLNRIRVIIGNSAEVRPVRQIVEAETKVLGKTRSVLLLSTILIAVMVALCVLATLTSSVLERRKDFAVMKAIGSSQTMLNAIFLTESLLLATLGAILGFVIGSGMAAWIGRANFHAAVMPQISVFPAVFAGSLLIAFLSAVVPLHILQKIQPAVILKGE